MRREFLKEVLGEILGEINNWNHWAKIYHAIKWAFWIITISYAIWGIIALIIEGDWVFSILGMMLCGGLWYIAEPQKEKNYFYDFISYGNKWGLGLIIIILVSVGITVKLTTKGYVGLLNGEYQEKRIIIGHPLKLDVTFEQVEFTFKFSNEFYDDRVTIVFDHTADKTIDPRKAQNVIRNVMYAVGSGPGASVREQNTVKVKLLRILKPCAVKEVKLWKRDFHNIPTQN